MRAQIDHGAVVHFRCEGRSMDVALSDLDVGIDSSDAAIKQALARYFEMTPNRLRDHVIDRHETGNLTVRPAAVFG
jgi:hypothetical protein